VSVPPPSAAARSSGGPTRHPTRHGAGTDLLAGLLPLAAVAGSAVWLLGLPRSYLVESATVYAALAAGILLLLPASQLRRGLGAANRVTLGRAALAVPVATLILHPAAHGTAAHWWIIGVSTMALVLDGVDGWVARRTGTATPFGARLDMELDAALILALSVLVWQGGRAGAWVLLVGALRYLFVAAGVVWPFLRGELPPSRRRRVVCVVQGVVLLVALGPIIPSGMAAAVAALGLALLLYSFAADILWLGGA